MRQVKRKPKGTAYRVLDKVRTHRGEGVIRHVFPQGPHGKKLYSVELGSKRVGVIFDEDEITPLE